MFIEGAMVPAPDWACPLKRIKRHKERHLGNKNLSYFYLMWLQETIATAYPLADL
jgi:hypothetical protein